MPHTLADPPDSEQGPQLIPFRPRPPIVQPLTDSQQQFRIGLVEAIMSQPPHVAQLTDTLRLERAAEHLNATVCSQFDVPIVPLADQPQPSAALWRDLVELVRIDLGLSLSSRPVPEAHLNHALDLKVEQVIALVLNSDYTIADLKPMLRAEVRAAMAEAVALDRAIQQDDVRR